jgi:hypothetical protein
MKRRSLSDASLFHEGSLVGIDQLVNQEFLGRSIELGIPLGDDVKRQRAVPILDGRGFGSNVQNLSNHSRPSLGVTLTGNGLVKNRRRNVVVHDHRRDWNQVVAPNTVQH